MAERHSSRYHRAFDSAAAVLVLPLLLCFLLTFQLTLLIGMLREREAGGISSMIDAEINVCKCKRYDDAPNALPELDRQRVIL